MSTSAIHVFNQYYFDLLKKVKDVARDLKHKTEDHGARDILREIKRTYLSYNKGSDEYVEWFRSNMKVFTDGLEKEDFDAAKWFENEDYKTQKPYQGISVDMLCKLIRSKDVLLYYFILLSIFSDQAITDETVKKLVEIMKSKKMTPEQINDIEGFSLQHKMILLESVQQKQQSSTPKPEEMFGDIESTTLGRLAKEIMNEVNLDEIQQKVGQDGDLMKALGDPDSGLTKLLGTVSQKMISKMASGELNQQNLLQDAMKFASTLPNMMSKGGAGPSQSGGMGGLGDMGSMLESVSQLAGLFGGNSEGGMGGMGDLANMMKQFTGGGGKANKNTGAKTQINQPAVNRAVMAKQLRRKLEERRKTKENID